MSAFQIDDLPIESQMLTKSLDEAQKKVENYFFDLRKNLFEYDQVLNTQRNRVYAERRLALLTPELIFKIEEYTENMILDIVNANIGPIKKKPIEDWPLELLAKKMRQHC